MWGEIFKKLYDAWYSLIYAVVDNKIISIIIFLTFVSGAWGSYTYIPQVITKVFPPKEEIETLITQEDIILEQENKIITEEKIDVVNTNVPPWKRGKSSTKTKGSNASENAAPKALESEGVCKNKLLDVAANPKNRYFENADKAPIPGRYLLLLSQSHKPY